MRLLRNWMVRNNGGIRKDIRNQCKLTVGTPEGPIASSCGWTRFADKSQVRRGRKRKAGL